MPSSAYVQSSVGQRLAGRSFQSTGSTPPEVLISMISNCALGQDYAVLGNAVVASTAYPAANRALGFQFSIAEPFTVQKVWWANGTTATTDSADVGVYTEAGTLIVSGGSTAIATASRIQEKDCTDTVLPAPGRYWAVYAQSGTTATPLCFPGTSLHTTRLMGVAQFAGAVPLGATFTPAAVVSQVFPWFGIAGRTQVA